MIGPMTKGRYQLIYKHTMYDYRDELIVQDQLTFKGKKLVTPAAEKRNDVNSTLFTYQNKGAVFVEYRIQCTGLT